MKKLFLAYQVLAYVVGVLLVIGAVEMVLEYLVPDEWAIARFADDLAWVWMVHGPIYMVYLVVAFVIVQKAGWALNQFFIMLAAGLVPGLMFWVERRVVHRLREDHPELART